MPFPKRLIEGYSAFRAERLPHEQQRFTQLAEQGQAPEIMVIGCCDSRVSPEAIFDAGPGELFVARNIANLVPPYTPDSAQRAMSAALEFAVQALKVKHIVVLAHAQCGGIRAYAEEAEPLSPVDHRTGGQSGRSARRPLLDRVCYRTRADRRGEDARQPDDVSLRAAPRPDGRIAIARRLLRRRDGRFVGA
jgi:carbonic anhydrase